MLAIPVNSVGVDMEWFSLKAIRTDRADLLQTDTWPEVGERTLVNQNTAHRREPIQSTVRRWIYLYDYFKWRGTVYNKTSRNSLLYHQGSNIPRNNGNRPYPHEHNYPDL